MRAPRFSKAAGKLRLWNPPPATSGLPWASATEERVGFALASAVVLFVFLVAVWGVSGIFPDGHFGAQANMGIAGYNMSRYGTIYPIFPFLDHPGSSANAYMHHPLGMFWMTGLLIKVLGPENWVLRLPAIVYATLTAFFMYRCGRSIWGPLEGAVATLAYAALPITLGFANFHSLEQPLMLGCLVATWGYARFSQTGRGAYAAASIAGFGFAALHDWEAYVWGATFLFWLFLRFFVVPARLLGSSVDERRAGRYWALMVGTALVTLSITLWLVISSGKLSELMSMYSVRSSGAGLPLRTVLDSRHVRIELMFTGLGIALGKLALPVIVARFFLRRDERELLPLFVFVMAVVQYVVFKQGADVHIFWPHPFTIYFGLAMGSLVAGVRGAWRWLAGQSFARGAAWLPGAKWAPWLAVGLVVAPLLFVLRDGVSLLRLSRESGGRFMEVHLESHVDEAVALRWFLDTYFPSPLERVAFHASVPNQWATQWEIRPRVVVPHQPVLRGKVDPRAFLLDTRFTSVGELREAAQRYHVHAVGWFWLMDRAAPAAPLDGYRFDEHDPGFFEGLKYGVVEPIRKVVPDPWVTWEWRNLLGQPVQPPPATPRTAEQIRIAHNVAVAAGDAAAAARWRQALARHFAITTTVKWDNGTELIGTMHERGAARRLTLFFLAGTFHGDPKPGLRARVVARRPLSTLPIDTPEPDIAPPPEIPCELWRPGFIYSLPAVYRHRAGREEFAVGFHQAHAPRRVGGPFWAPLATF